MLLIQNKKYGYRDMAALSFKVAPVYSTVYAVKLIIDALTPTLSIFVTANFLNSAIAVYQNEAHISAVYLPVGLLIGIMLYNTLSWVVMNFINSRRQISFRNKINPEMYMQIATLEFKHLENPKTMDLINRISWSFMWEVWGMYNQVLWVLVYLGQMNYDPLSQYGGQDHPAYLHCNRMLR